MNANSFVPVTSLTDTPVVDKVLMIPIKLSSSQDASIKKHYMDFNYIKDLQNENRYPRQSTGFVWKAGNNFENAVYVGTRAVPGSSSTQMVFLKNDGWFTTPEDLTNCNPITEVTQENGTTIKVNVPKKNEDGYLFSDMGVIAAQNASQGIVNASQGVANYFGKLNGGRKSRKYKKRNLKSKSKRRYRK
jgi:hypothetical protein